MTEAMSHLRWIILGIGIGLILLIYFLGRSKKKQRLDDFTGSYTADEMPSITAADSVVDNKTDLDDLPFVPSEINQFELNDELVEKVSASVDDGLLSAITSGTEVELKAPQPPLATSSINEKSDQQEVVQNQEFVADESVKATAEEQDVETESQLQPIPEAADDETFDDDLVVIHVEAKDAYFNGLDLLRVINQQQLKFGDMNIYHAYDDEGVILFSMSNMIKPGHFEPEHFSEMCTPGVILFMQLSLIEDTEPALDRMLHCAHALATELRAGLTGASRMRLSEQDIQMYKRKALYFSQSEPA